MNETEKYIREFMRLNKSYSFDRAKEVVYTELAREMWISFDKPRNDGWYFVIDLENEPPFALEYTKEDGWFCMAGYRRDFDFYKIYEKQLIPTE